MKEHIVIVGGGFGGLTAATRLASLRKRRDAYSISLIDRGAVHLYYPLIYEVATGWFDVKDDKDSDAFRRKELALAKGSTVAFTDLRRSLARKGVRVEDAEVVGLDSGASVLLLADGRRVPYDRLILALGSEKNTFGIEGLEEHAHFLYSLRGALAIRRRLHDLVEKRRKNAIPHIHVVIGGAGATGVEFACELSSLFRKLERKGELSRSDWTIDMVEAGSRPLGGFHQDISRWAMRRIEKRGIKVFLDTCIKGAHKDHLVLAPRPLRDGETQEDLLCDFRKENEKEITYDLLVWTGGSKPSSLLGAMGLPLDRKGRVLTDERLRAKEHADIWVVGDCAGIVDASGHPVPPLAQAAIAEGRTAAEDIVAEIEGREPVPYGFPKMGAIIPMGGSYGTADVFGLRVKGRIVYLLKLAAEARYFFTTFPPGIAWKMLRRIVRAYRMND